MYIVKVKHESNIHSNVTLFNEKSNAIKFVEHQKGLFPNCDIELDFGDARETFTFTPIL